MSRKKVRLRNAERYCYVHGRRCRITLCKLCGIEYCSEFYGSYCNSDEDQRIYHPRIAEMAEVEAELLARNKKVK